MFWIDLEKGSTKLSSPQAFFPWPHGEQLQDWCEMVLFINWVAVRSGLSYCTTAGIPRVLLSLALCSVHLPVLILEMSRHIGKENMFLENKVRMYYFSATVGLAAMLQEYKVSPMFLGCVLK